MRLLLFFVSVFLGISVFRCSDIYYTSADTGEEYHSYSADYFESWPGYRADIVGTLLNDLPIIVWWTHLVYPHGGFENKKNEPTYAHLTCPNGANCYSTVDRSTNLMNDNRTRGILFYGTDFDPQDLPLPRLKYHEWALIHEESPLNNYILSHPSLMHLFNHTSTFRRESDYPLSSQGILQTDYLISRKPVSTAQKNKAKTSKGFAPIVYIQSHCDVPSDRDSYVKELMKYINIDSYGACLHNKDLPEYLLEPAESFLHHDLLELLSYYKFNLAFENAYCDDYMTEKIMRPLHIGVVPVYKGSPVVQDWMPNNHSIILVDDFNSPKELAEYIKFLDSNDDEYEKFLDFKRTEIENTFLTDHLQEREWSEGQKDFFRGFECYVCKQLTVRVEAEKMHTEYPSSPLLPPRMATYRHFGCPTPERLDIGFGIDNIWPDTDWTSLYWDGIDNARAVQRMLEVGESDSKTFDRYHREILEGIYPK